MVIEQQRLHRKECRIRTLFNTPINFDNFLMLLLNATIHTLKVDLPPELIKNFKQEFKIRCVYTGQHLLLNRVSSSFHILTKISTSLVNRAVQCLLQHIIDAWKALYSYKLQCRFNFGKANEQISYRRLLLESKKQITPWK